MTVQEFFKTLDKDKFVKYYIKDYCNQRVTENRKMIVGNYVDELLSAQVKENKDMYVFSMVSMDSLFLNSFAVNRDDFGKEEIEHYAYDLEDPLDVLGYQVSKACKYYLKDDYRFASSILYELSMFGYSLKKQTDGAKDIISSVKEATKNIDISKLTSAESLFKELGYVDNRTEQEKELDVEMIKIENYCTVESRKALCKLELVYASE